jgi:glycerol kinase
MQYVIGIDQSTQGTKALLLDEKGTLLLRRDLPHRQIISEQGWVSHDPEEIYHNTVKAVQNLVEKSASIPHRLRRWESATKGKQRQSGTGRQESRWLPPWCGSATVRGELSTKWKRPDMGEYVRKTTGIPLSAYFPAAKMAWLLRDCRERGAVRESDEQEICLGTMDSWLIFKLTRRTRI